MCHGVRYNQLVVVEVEALRCFNREAIVPVDQVAFIFTRVDEISRDLSVDLMRTRYGPNRIVERFIKWEYPREG